MAKTPLANMFAPNDYQQRLLAETTITPVHPGPILRDFQTLLEFIGSAGVPGGGKYHFLPINILNTLNEHMCLQIKVDLERPQLRSYPNLQGLHLLSRASGLVVALGAGSKARLVVDPAALASWMSLNPAEQYFSLLDAFFTRARKAMLGGNDRFGESLLDYSAGVFGMIPEKGTRYSHKQRAASNAMLWPDPDRYTLVLLALFGFVEIEQGDPIAGRPWMPALIRRTEFGHAMIAALSPRIGSYRRALGLELSFDEFFAAPRKRKSSSKRAGGGIRFDSFHPIFTPYFPELQNSLGAEPARSRDGIFIFHVSLGKEMWRRIAAPAESTLEDLAFAILDSVRFEMDHLWEFSYTDRTGAPVRVQCSDADLSPGESPAHEFQISQLTLQPGEAMIFLFDYGDSWRFKVLLEKVDPPAARWKKPKVIEKHGKAPEQYPNWDE